MHTAGQWREDNLEEGTGGRSRADCGSSHENTGDIDGRRVQRVMQQHLFVNRRDGPESAARG